VVATEVESRLSRALTPTNLVEQEFRRLHPEAKDVFAEGQKIRVRAAREKFDKIYSEEKRRLAEFTDEEVPLHRAESTRNIPGWVAATTACLKAKAGRDSAVNGDSGVLL
jgi:hypothetical protein